MHAVNGKQELRFMGNSFLYLLSYLDHSAGRWGQDCQGHLNIADQLTWGDAVLALEAIANKPPTRGANANQYAQSDPYDEYQ